MFEFWLLILAVLLGTQSVLKAHILQKGKTEKIKTWLHIVEVFIIISALNIAKYSVAENGILAFFVGGCLGIALCFKLFCMYNDYK